MNDSEPPTEMPQQATSPLAEADPASLDELIANIKERVGDIFNKPADQATDDELAVVVRYYRLKRQRYAIESKTVKPGPKRKVPTSVTSALKAEDLDI